MSVTGGFQEEFREKVLGVNAHVIVLKYSRDFREYRDVMEKVASGSRRSGVDPFVINPMMVTHGDGPRPACFSRASTRSACLRCSTFPGTS